MNEFANLVQTNIIRIKNVIRKKKDRQKLKNSEYTFPMDLFDDRTHENEMLIEKAKYYALYTEQDVTNVLLSNRIDVIIDEDSPFIGHTTVRYDYKLSESVECIPDKLKLENKIESQLNIDHVRVVINANSLHVTIPLPNKLHIMIDTRKIVEATY